MRTLRIFISSPGDVAEERKLALQVVSAIQQRRRSQVRLDPLVWEHWPLPASSSAQAGVDARLAGTEEIDIAIFILWHRMGTPLEPGIVKQDGSPYLSGTERELDLMLEAFQRSGNQRPLTLVYARKDEEGFRKKLTGTELDRDAIRELLDQQQALEQFIKTQFFNGQKQNLHARHTYRDPEGFAQRLIFHLDDAISSLLAHNPTAPLWQGSPYRSLEYFDLDHALIFCGRDEETGDVLDQLSEQRQAGRPFVVILGASGAGKSSLARAGVAAFLIQQPYLAGIKKWLPVIIIPGRQPHSLHTTLALGLESALPALSQLPGGIEALSSNLDQQNFEAASILLTLAFQSAEREAGGPVRIILVVDQLEELWLNSGSTQVEPETFFRILDWLCTHHPVDIIATLRSDCYHLAQSCETFMKLKVGAGQFDLTAPGDPALRQMITEPARLAGLTFGRDPESQQALDEQLLAASRRQPDALPLLQYTLSELSQRVNDARELTFAAYQELGEIEGAVGRRAQTAFDAIGPEAQATFDEITFALVTVSPSGESQAHRLLAPHEEITNTPAKKELVNALIQHRLLISSAEGVTLAHEALLRRWEKLADAIARHTETLRLRASIEQNFLQWQRAAEDASLLLQKGLPLEEGRRLLKAPQGLISEPVLKYIRASLKEARKNQIVKWGVGTLASIVIVGLVIAYLLLRTSRELADENLQLSNANLQEAVLNHWGSAREAFELNDDPPAGFAHLASAVRFNEKLPGDLQTANLHQDAVLRLLLAPTVNALPATTPALPGKWISHAEFSRDGSQILTCAGSSVNLWDGHTLKALVAPLTLPAEATFAAISPAKTTLIAIVADQTVYLWDPSGITPATPQQLPHPEKVRHLAFSPDGSRLITSSVDGLARIWTLGGANQVNLTVPHQAEFLPQFSPDGTKILAGSSPKSASLFDAATGKPCSQPMSHQGAVTHAYFNPDGTRVLTASGCNPSETSSDPVCDNTIRIWDSLSGKAEGSPLRHDNVTQVILSTDGDFILSVSAEKVQVWDVERQTLVTPAINLQPVFSHTSSTRFASFHPDGFSFATASGNRHAILKDIFTGKAIGSPLYHQGSVYLTLFSPDGQRLLTGSDGGGLLLWHPDTGAPSGECLDPGPADHVQFSPDGRYLLAIDNTVDSARPNTVGTARWWDLATRQPAAPPLVCRAPILGADFSPDSQRLLIVSGGGVQVYRTASGAPASPSIFSPLPIWCARFSPDGHLIATGSAPVRPRPASYAEINVSSNPLRGEARLWRSATGRQTGRTLHHEGPVNSLLFSPDGTRLLTASQDKTSRIWSVPDGHPVGDIMLHDHPVNDLSLDAGGKILLTGSGVSQSEKVQQAGALRLWDPLTGKPASPVMETHSLTRKVRLAPGGETWLTLVGGSANNAESQYSLWFPQKARRGFVPLPLKKRIRSALWTTPEKGTWRGDYVTSFGYGGWDSWSYSGSGSYYSYSYDYYYRLSVAPHSEPCPLSYHPKESSIATLQEGGLSFWSTTDGRAIGPRVLITSASRDTPSVCYSPDGRWLATAGGKCGMRLWDVGTTGVLASAEDLQMIGGVSVSHEGLLQPVPLEDRLQWRAQLLDSAPQADSPWRSIVRWHLTPRNSRPLFPHSPLSLADQVNCLSQRAFDTDSSGEGDQDILKEVYFLNPSHPLANRLAAGLLANYASQIASPSEDSSSTSGEERDARRKSAIKYADKALSLDPASPGALRAKANGLWWLKQPQEALAVRQQLCATPHATEVDFGDAMREAGRAGNRTIFQLLLADGERRFPGSFPLLLQRAHACLELKDPAEAVEAFAAARTQNPRAFHEDDLSHPGYAAALWAVGTPESKRQAISDFSALIGRRSDYGTAWASRQDIESNSDIEHFRPILLDLLTATLAKHPDLAPKAPPK